MKFTDKQLEKLIRIKKQIVNSHKECKGEGFIPDKEENIIPCICQKVLRYISALVYFNIPKEYWQLDFNEISISKLSRDKVINYYKNLENAIDNGVGLFISCKKKGVGKTTVACEIAKKAITLRYSVCYQLMNNIIDNMFTNTKEILERINKSDLIIIDEFEKVMMKEDSQLIKKIENFLRDLLPNGKSVIICTNDSIDNIEKKLKLKSLLQRNILSAEFDGEDYSEKKNKQLSSMLNEKYNYMHKNIVKMAELYYQNEYIANEREFNENFS
jgi:hypothetical protein